MGVLYRFLGCVVAMPVAAWLLPGVHTVNAETAWIAGIVLGLIYLILRPIAKLILSPLNCLSFGVLGFVVDTLFVLLTSHWLSGFVVDSFLWAFAASAIVAVLREGAGWLAGKR